MVCVNVSPRVALVDEKVSITVNSLRPHQRVTIQLWVEEGKAVFSSCGHFLADQQGVINVSQHPSLGGTYRGEGPFPGVLDMLGSAGGLAEFRAALLASRGFACFALAYLRYDDLPASPADIDFDYFLDAVDWLTSHPSVQSGGIGVVGASKGGELTFLLGMSTNQVKAMVNISGAPVYSLDDLIKSGRTFRKGFELDKSKLIHTDEGVSIKDSCPYDAEIIPAWANNAQILYLCGEDDGVWRTDFANAFIEACPEEKRKNIELMIYPGAGHLIEPPYMPLCTSVNNKTLDMRMAMGGHTEAHAAAQEDAWRRLLNFLETHLSQ